MNEIKLAQYQSLNSTLFEEISWDIEELSVNTDKCKRDFDKHFLTFETYIDLIH